MSKRLLVTLVGVVVLSGAAACRKPPTTGTSSAQGAGPTASAPGTAIPPTQAPAPVAPPLPVTPPAPVPAQLPDVVARVNSENVKKSDFDRLLRNVELNNGPVPPDRRDEIMRRILDELVTYTLLKQETQARNVTVTDAEVDEQVKSMRQTAGTEEAFKKALADRRMSLERLKTDARVELAIAKMMNAQVAGAQPATDADARGFYVKNPDRFKRAETVRASHILIRVDPKADDAARKQARAKIDAVLKRAQAGEDFAALARENSQDGSAAQGGDLNYFPRQKMVPAFADAAFALKPGELSEVVTTQFGFHIIKVTDRKPAGTVPLDEVSPQVKQFLTEQKKQQQAQAFITQLKQKSKIEVLI